VCRDSGLPLQWRIYADWPSILYLRDQLLFNYLHVVNPCILKGLCYGNWNILGKRTSTGFWTFGVSMWGHAVKGTMTWDGYFFWRPKNYHQYFCVCADGHRGLTKAFHYPIQLLTFLFASLKYANYYLLILKMFTESLLRIPFSVIGRTFSSAASRWLQGKCERVYF
jgi:hypothetical protein